MSDLRVYFQCTSVNCNVEVFSAKNPLRDGDKFAANCPLCLHTYWKAPYDPGTRTDADSDAGGEGHRRNGGCVLLRTSHGPGPEYG